MASFNESVVGRNCSGDPELYLALIVVEIIECLPDSFVRKTTIRKSAANVSVMSIDMEIELPEKITPFDTFAQIIDGYVEIVIGGEAFYLETGQSIVIPAHAPSYTRLNSRSKMILTVVQSGYD